MCIAAFSGAQNMCMSNLMYCMYKYISGYIVHTTKTNTKLSFVRPVLQKHLLILLYSHLKKKKKSKYILFALCFF